MKTLKISSLAAVILCVSLFTACTKDLETSAAPSLITYEQNETSAAKKGSGEEGVETMNVSNQTKSNKALATISNFQLKSKPATVGSTVNLSANITFSADVHKAQVQIQKSVKDANGNWSDWTVVTDYNAKIELKEKTDAPVRSYTVDYAFLATEAGESRWLLHVGGGDVTNTLRNYQTLVVTDCVKELMIEPTVIGEDQKNGTYKFTVTYKLTNPVDLPNIHFQGGATSGGQFQHLLETNTAAFTVKHDNQNSVLTYTGALKACKPLELSFTYIRKFSCPADAAAVTGEWKLLSDNVEKATVAPLVFSSN